MQHDHVVEKLIFGPHPFILPGDWSLAFGAQWLSGGQVECLSLDLGVAGLSLTGVTVLCP